MRKEDLKKLRQLKKEAAHLQSQYDDIICFPKEEVGDTCSDYRTGHPHTIVLFGVGDAKYAELRDRISQKNRKICDQIKEMEDWLDKVENPEMRDILRMQYVSGMTQEEIAEELGHSLITIKRRLAKFWEL